MVNLMFGGRYFILNRQHLKDRTGTGYRLKDKGKLT